MHNWVQDSFFRMCHHLAPLAGWVGSSANVAYEPSGLLPQFPSLRPANWLIAANATALPITLIFCLTSPVFRLPRPLTLFGSLPSHLASRPWATIIFLSLYHSPECTLVTIRAHAHCQQAQHLLYITYLSYNQILIALQIH
jgi:hypothetical protein